MESDFKTYPPRLLSLCCGVRADTQSSANSPSKSKRICSRCGQNFVPLTASASVDFVAEKFAMGLLRDVAYELLTKANDIGHPVYTKLLMRAFAAGVEFAKEEK